MTKPGANRKQRKIYKVFAPKQLGAQIDKKNVPTGRMIDEAVQWSAKREMLLTISDNELQLGGEVARIRFSTNLEDEVLEGLTEYKWLIHMGGVTMRKASKIIAGSREPRRRRRRIQGGVLRHYEVDARSFQRPLSLPFLFLPGHMFSCELEAVMLYAAFPCESLAIELELTLSDFDLPLAESIGARPLDDFVPVKYDVAGCGHHPVSIGFGEVHGAEELVVLRGGEALGTKSVDGLWGWLGDERGARCPRHGL
ncbi:hypothetical protein DFH07DRAFT_776884 [Mycena maculata]|uniref:Uncharacterized protein n=1 Tax=Mycena maculata TaxID=230809 RepID=A0AAD7N587_9AGAR|nr:hypothetical protein DFH07DRAFT_776884 [Mycena maculata]